MRLTTKNTMEIFKGILEEKGYCSCSMVADRMGELDIVTWTGEPPTRQTVYYHMSKTEEGKSLIAEAKGKFPSEHFIAKKFQKAR